jgi:hypothetical protein
MPRPLNSLYNGEKLLDLGPFHASVTRTPIVLLSIDLPGTQPLKGKHPAIRFSLAHSPPHTAWSSLHCMALRTQLGVVFFVVLSFGLVSHRVPRYAHSYRKFKFHPRQDLYDAKYASVVSEKRIKERKSRSCRAKQIKVTDR